MEHESENALWESCLKNAVMQNSLSETEHILSDPAYNSTDVPERYQQNMRRFIRKRHRRIKPEAARKALSKRLSDRCFAFKSHYRTVIALLIIACTGSLFFMQFDVVRSACSHVLTHVFENYIKFDFTPENSTKTAQLVLHYIPEGFELSESDFGEGLDTLVYENSEGCMIAAACFKSNSAIQMDHEHFQVSEIMINNSKGTYFKSQDNTLRDYILWSSNDSYFMLSSQLSLEEMKKIAENMDIR